MVRQIARKAALVAIVLLLAGCTGAGPSSGPSESSSTTTGPRSTPQVEVTALPFNFDAAAGNQSSPAGPADVALISPTKGGPFSFDDGATTIIAEAKWACESPTCRMYVSVFQQVGTTTTYLFSSGGDGNARAESPSDVDLTPEGKWGAVMRADTAVSGVQGEIRVSVFYDGAVVPDGYTAF